MAPGKLTLLPVHEVELDRTNPRIRRFLENYEGEPTYEQIALALDVAGGGEDAQGATTPQKLRASILTNGGIMQPIIVNKDAAGRLICIEGNTRLYIYRAFVSEEVEGDWTHILALVHEGLGSMEVDAIRLQAHLVGPRPWDAYSKAKYLWELQHKELMPLDRIIAFCGGNRRDVTQAIQAYADMEHYYKPLCEGDYDTEKYSGFVELQNSRVKDAILRAGFSLADFGRWIRNNNLEGRLEQVRKLPRVLADKRARAVFVAKNIKAALDILEKPEYTASLKGASIGQLARALTERIESIPYAELKRLQSNAADDDSVRYITDALEAIQGLVNDINKGP